MEILACVIYLDITLIKIHRPDNISCMRLKECTLNVIFTVKTICENAEMIFKNC